MCFICKFYYFILNKRNPAFIPNILINEKPGSWLHTLGLVTFSYFDKLHNGDYSLFICKEIRNSSYPEIEKPIFVYKPLSTTGDKIDQPTRVEIDPDGKLYAIGTNSGTVTLFDMETRVVS